MPEFGIAPENTVFISGIGCSSRFPYYMNTYGFHTIHGRAPAFATGLKISRPDLDVWVVTGDGDGLSIGGNHLIHVLRRNVDLKILLFNNKIYGLTKGQYSPTSEVGKVTKSTPMGSVDFPFNPITVALGTHATFVARTINVEQKHLGEMLKRAHAHRGASFVEILQNCNIFNDGAFNNVSDKALKADHQLILEHGKPLIFGKNRDMGIRMNGMRPEAVKLSDGVTEGDLVVHDETNLSLAFMLGNFEPPTADSGGSVLRGLAADLRRRREQAARRRKGKAGRRRPENAPRQGRYVDSDQLTREHLERMQKGPRAGQSGGSFLTLSRKAYVALSFFPSSFVVSSRAKPRTSDLLGRRLPHLAYGATDLPSVSWRAQRGYRPSALLMTGICAHSMDGLRLSASEKDPGSLGFARDNTKISR